MSLYYSNRLKRKSKEPTFESDRILKSGCISTKTTTTALAKQFSEASKAFTLIEVILAITIAGAVLAGAASLMVSITDTWLQRQDRHFFEDHVDGVTEFIQASFSKAGQEISLNEANSTDTDNSTESTQTSREAESTVNVKISLGNGNASTSNEDQTSTSATEGSSLLRASEEPIRWAQPPGFANYKDPLLNFGLKDTPPLLVQIGNAPTGGIQAYLYFDKDEGLSILWYSPLQEDSEDINDLRRTPVSDLVTAIKYIYWDESFEKWEEEEDPLDGEGDNEFLLPRFIKLAFEHEGITKERIVVIPIPSQRALLF